MFAHQTQPFDNVCGQTVVAMVTGLPVETVIAEMRRRTTGTAVLQNFLIRHGWEMLIDKTRLPSLPPGPAVLLVHRIVDNRLLGHWVLWTGEEFLDPADARRKSFGGDCAGRFYTLKKL